MLYVDYIIIIIIISLFYVWVYCLLNLNSLVDYNRTTSFQIVPSWVLTFEYEFYPHLGPACLTHHA